MAMAAQTIVISFRKLLAENSVVRAEQMITKWDPNTFRSPHAQVTSIFRESRDEARRFLTAVHDLHHSMQRSNLSESSLHHKHILMETAMNRLKKELAEMDAISPVNPAPPPSTVMSADASSTFRSYLTDYGSDGEESSPTVALDYLRAVVECMISCGYARECLETYKLRRLVVVEESLSRLGLEHLCPSHVQKLNCESLDFRIKRWLVAADAVFDEVFTVERLLCDFVFASSESMGDTCFAEITREAAIQFFKFPYVMTLKNKRVPESVFGYLNMYRKIVDLTPEIESAFSSKATNMVQSQVTASLDKLAQTIKSMLAEFESTVHRDSSKHAPHGGGLHVLTQSVMNHLVLLADYGDILAELYADDPLPCLEDLIPEPAAAVTTKRSNHTEVEAPVGIRSSGAARLAWLVTVLLCKLDVKAELYKEAWQSYLFLANNHQHVVNRVRESSKLAKLLGQEWLSTHEKKARSFARSFLRLGWKRVLEALPADPSVLVGGEEVEAQRERVVQFNRAFEEACESQEGWVVLDGKVREEIRSAIARNVVRAYRPFYERYREALRAEGGVRYAPEDLENHLAGLYDGSPESSEWESLPASGRGSGKGSRWRWLRESL